MSKYKPTYFLTPPRPSPPDGPIRLGAIIPSPAQPDEPLYLPSLPESTDTSTFTEYNWTGSYVKASSSHFGIWTSFLEVVLGVGADVGVELDKSLERKWDVERMTTQTFLPSRSFLEQVVQHEDVKRYIIENRFREKVYMITGVMIASSSTVSSEKLQECGVYVHAGVDATAWAGVPISVGPEGKWKQKKETRESSRRPDEFVFAYRIRQIKIGRKGEIKSEKVYDKGALFDTHRERATRDIGEMELEGLGDEADIEDIELESREVRQEMGGGQEEEFLCVLPEPLD
ncbi:hypothetical protein yc1106_05913 [Curvularia clavata]|uniref:Uncharacterized protein n=1 Tax=Curvularia clavata TaxID=95742 RepID=A0A9Q9DUB6_CURCL|nr:hypothetical protein yc1106_05913 [Curvularia clavata]